ncbi:hypothetical protein M3Y95_00571400 [Aphelenchoides besseyi]|nr:hypothetical protein M3Y95_00571400 [Aphelenchoides besseyi]
MAADPNNVSTQTAVPAVSDSKPSEEGNIFKTIGRWCYVIVYTIYKTIAVICQLVKIFYQFLVLLYQYPNATSYAIEVTYNSILLMYRSGLWDPFQKKAKLAKMPTETAIPISPEHKVANPKPSVNKPNQQEVSNKKTI